MQDVQQAQTLGTGQYKKTRKTANEQNIKPSTTGAVSRLNRAEQRETSSPTVMIRQLTDDCIDIGVNTDIWHILWTHTQHTASLTVCKLMMHRYFIRRKILKLVTWPWPCPFQRRFVADRLRHDMTNLSTKFEVPNSTDYGNIKSIAKCRKLGGLGWLGSPKVIENSAIRYSAYAFLLAFHSKYVPILHRFWDIARYWSNRDGVNLPHLYLAPPVGVISLECRQDY